MVDQTYIPTQVQAKEVEKVENDDNKS